MHKDNEACSNFPTMPKMSPRTKHIEILYHFLRIQVENLEIKIVGIHTENQLVDQFTRGPHQDSFLKTTKS